MCVMTLTLPLLMVEDRWGVPLVWSPTPGTGEKKKGQSTEYTTTQQKVKVQSTQPHNKVQ